nr:reverse transcriptase domain-containing protein [Tanacetum cinerariifolium]
MAKMFLAHHNDWDTSSQRSESSSSITSSSDTEIAPLKAKMAEINKNLMRVLQFNQQVKAVTPSCETCGGLYSFNDCPATVGNTLNGNNQRRNQFFQGASLGQNPPSAFQAPVHQPQIPQPQVVTTNEFTNFMKENDAILKNMQTNMTSLTNSNIELKNMFGQFMKMNTASSSSWRTLPCNTITNPKEELKGITTRSGTAYQGPTIPTTSSSLPPVVERENKATKDAVHPTNNESTKDIQPPVVQSESPILNSESVVAPLIELMASRVSAPQPNQRPSIPYPSRLHDQKLHDKADDQRENFFQIFKDLNFNISFADALILMPKFGPSIKILLTNKDKLFELARTPLNEHCSVILLKKLPEKLGDPGKFLIPCDFSGMAECLALAYLSASINLMPLSIWNKLSLPELTPTLMTLELADWRSFLKTERALIDVFETNYNDMTANRIDVIDMACEEYSQEVLGFSDVIASGNPTPYYDPIVSTTSLNLTPYRNSDFLLEEIDAFLALKDDPTSSKVDQSYVDTEGDILLLEAFLNDDPSLPPPNQGNYLPKFIKNLKFVKLKPINLQLINLPRNSFQTCLSHLERMLKRCEDTNLCLNWEKSHFMVMEGIFLDHMISKNRINVDKAKVDVIAKLPHPTTVKGIRSFLSHAGFYQRFIKDFLKIARLMTRLLEKDTPFLLSKECVEGFKTLKRKLTEAPILMAPDWDFPFELMCDANDFAISAVLGQSVVCAFEKFRSYLIMNKSIVYTNHSALKYLFAKKDSKARLLCWVLLLQEFTFKVIDTKGAENLAADHLSRLENPHQTVLDPKEINESFPLETLNLVSTRDLEPPEPSSVIEERTSAMTNLQRTVGKNHASWSDKLDDALWAFRTAYKTPIGCTLYKLVYGKACYLTIELEHKAYWALKHANFDLQTAGDHKKVQLNEFRNQAYENSLIYKEKTKRLYDSKIIDRVFNIDDRVLLFNSRLKIFSGKLKSRWFGPFSISHVFPYGTIELSQPDGPNFKVNGHILKHYFGEDIPKMVVP